MRKTINCISPFLSFPLSLAPYGYARKRFHHSQEDYIEEPQEITEYSPHDYFLKHTYIPSSWGHISTQHLDSLLPRDIHEFCRRMHMKQLDMKINYDLFQKILKVRILLLHTQSKLFKKGFQTRAALFLKNLVSMYLDHKYSQLYEEGLICKLVETIKDAEVCEVECDRKEAFILIDKVIQNNKMIIKHIGMVCDELGLAWDEVSRATPLRDGAIDSKYERKMLPIKLFETINRPYQFRSDFNSIKPNENRYDDEYMVMLLNYLKHSTDRQQFKTNIARQVRFFENVKLTKIDFLVGLLFNLQSGFYRDNYFQMITDFVVSHGSQQSNIQNRILETILLIRIFNVLQANMEDYNESDAKTNMKTNLRNYYEKYCNLFASMIEEISFEGLYNLLGFHLKIFQQYLPIHFQDKATRKRFKLVYYKLFSRIFGYCENGLLLIQSSKSINFLLEAILVVYDQEDEEMVLRLMEQYEQMLPLLPWRKEEKHVYQYRADYLICIKYGFKSDLIAEKLYIECQNEAWLKQHSIRNTNKKYIPRKKQKLLLDYFIYLSIVQTQDEKSASIEKEFISTLEMISLQHVMRGFRPRNLLLHKEKIRYIKHHHKREQKKSVNPPSLLCNERICCISQFFWMVFKMLENKPSEELKRAIGDKTIKCLESYEFTHNIKKYISFPNIYHNIKSIVAMLEIKDENILSFIKDIDDIVEEGKKSEIEEVKDYQKIIYKQNSHFLEQFPVSINASMQKLYGPNMFNTLLAVNQEKEEQELVQSYKLTPQQIKMLVESIHNMQIDAQEKKLASNVRQNRYFDMSASLKFKASLNNRVDKNEPAKEKNVKQTRQDIVNNWESYHDNIVNQEKKKDKRRTRIQQRKTKPTKPFQKSKSIEVKAKIEKKKEVKSVQNEKKREVTSVESDKKLQQKQQKPFFKETKKQQEAELQNQESKSIEQEQEQQQWLAERQFSNKLKQRDQAKQRVKELPEAKLLLPLQRIKVKLMEIAKIRQSFYAFKSQQLEKQVQAQLPAQVKTKAKRVRSKAKASESVKEV